MVSILQEVTASAWVPTAWSSRKRSALSMDSSWTTHKNLLHVVPLGCRGTACSFMGLFWVRQASVPHLGTSCPPSALTLMPVGVLHIFSLLSPRSCVTFFFPLFLKSTLPEEKLTFLIGSALARSRSLLDLVEDDRS